METGWDLLFDRSDLANVQIQQTVAPHIGDGEALLRVDRVGMTANNVTYALVGDAMNYWSFFPAPDGWGRVPLWGFADVLDSKVDGVEAGTRLYGYLPPSSHLIVRPAKISGAGFRDASEHRAQLPGAYNVYQSTKNDPAYEFEREDLQILYRPLFITSFMLDDFIGDNGFFGAMTAVLSSASSKTAYGTAFCMKRREDRPVLIGLTSQHNAEFTANLGCYDDVVTYDSIASLPTDAPTVYVDMAGSSEVRSEVHSHLGDRLVYDSVVGVTHHEMSLGGGDSDLPGPAPEFFFAPTQMKKRSQDWGPGGIERNFGAAWREFAPAVEGWVDVVESKGPEGLREAWLEVYSNKSDPRTGHVIAL